MKDKIGTGVNRIRRKKKIKKIAALTILLLMLILFILYIVFNILYNRGSFSIFLERDLYIKNGVIIYDDPDYKVFRRELHAEVIPFMDNISHKWLPDDIAEHPGGSHNGENYVAYTFFIENEGVDVVDFWTEIIIDHVLKNVDDAIRIRVYQDEEYVTYAKRAWDGNPEPDTIPFEDDTIVARNHIQNFRPGDIIKYTIVFWIEGSDPECTDNIIGGEIAFHKDFKSEIIR